MSKDLNNNERYLKELADKYKPVPPPLVWDEIEQDLDKDKGKRRSFPFIWISGVLVIGAMMFTYLTDTEDKGSPIVEQETIFNDYQKQSESKSRDLKSRESRSGDSKTREIRRGDSEVINEIKQGNTANFIETTTITTTSDTKEEKKVALKNVNSFVTQQPRQYQLNNLNTTSVDRSLMANTNEINAKAPVIITNEDIFRSRISTQATLEDINLIQVAALQRLERLRRPLEISRPLPDPGANLSDILIHNSRRHTSFSSPWFVELGGGIGRNLSNPELINPTLGTFRLNTESKWYSWSASFQLGYQFDNHWYTTLGFGLNQTKNRFDFWRRDISSLIINENQNQQITSGDFFNLGEISYTFADVGLSVGKRININRWHFSLEGGPLFNVLFNANGKVQIDDLEFSRLENQEEYFNTQIGFGARLSAMPVSYTHLTLPTKA